MLSRAADNVCEVLLNFTTDESKKFREDNLFIYFYYYSFNLSDLSTDSENDHLFREVDITGSSGRTKSTDSSDRTTASVE